MDPPAKKRRKESMFDISAKYKCVSPSKNFLSEPMLNYILKNSSQKAYYKLIQMSKYFLVNEPPQIKMFERIFYDGKWHNDPKRKLNGNRLWISANDFHWKRSSVSLNDLLQRCFRADITSLKLENQRLTCAELKVLMDSGNITILNLNQCKITHSYGDEVDIEDILEMAPLLEVFYYHPRKPFTLNCEKVSNLPDFDCLETIELIHLTQHCKCKSFRNFLKKISNITSGRFRFDDVSPKYLRDIQIAVLKEVDPDIKVTCVNDTIYFGDFDEEE